MPSKSEKDAVRSRLYMTAFAAGIFIIAAMPIFFYWSQTTKNPAEFKKQNNKYLTVVARVSDIAPEVMERVKAGEIQRDYNGEENARIVSILSIEPQAIGMVAVINNDYVNVVSDKTDMYLTLRLKYYPMGKDFLFCPSGSKIMIGTVFVFEGPDYAMNAEILEIEAPES